MDHRCGAGEMIALSSNNETNGGPREDIFQKKGKWRAFAVVLTGLLTSQGPLIYGHFALAREGVAKNDFVLFAALPFLSQALMVAVVVTTRVFVTEVPSPTIGWFGKNVRSALLGSVALTIVAMLMQGLVEFVARKLDVPTNEGVVLSSSMAGNVFLTVYTVRVVGLTPVIEELFWRMHFQGVLQRLFSAPIAILTQAVLFASVHMRGPAGSLEIFFIGLLYGSWRWRKGTLMPLIAAHMSLNALACIGIWQDELELRKVMTRQDYRVPLEAMCRPADYVPTQNALYDYERAFESLSSEPVGLDEINMWPGRLSAEKASLLRAWISSNETAIAQFGIAVKKPYYCPEYSNEPMEFVRHPTLLGHKTIVLATLSRACVEAIDHNLRQSVTDILMCYQFGQHLAGPKPLMEQLMGVAVQQHTTKVAFTILVHAEVNQACLQELQSGLEVVSEKSRVCVDFSGERLVCQALIQESFTDDGEGRGHMPQSSIRCIVNPPLSLRLRGFSRRDDARRWEELDRTRTALLADELFACLDSLKEYAPVDVWRKGADVQNVVQQVVGDNAFLGALIPGYVKAYYTAYRCQAFRDSLIVVTAIMRYRMAQGDLPDEIDQLLQKGYLRALPLDPFSGLPLVYRKVGQDFLLYSLGPDLEDDGGIGNTENGGELGGDDVFWPIADE